MIDGTFETHITVRAHEGPALRQFADEHGLKFLHIELDRGTWRSQPMLTLHGSGTLEAQQAVVREWCERLSAAGFAPQRSKIEATPWSAGVPETDADAKTEPADRYFEHHVKVRLSSARIVELLAVTEVAERHGARLSRNARRRDSDGAQERFVNQRCRHVGRQSAAERLDRLVEDFRAAGHEVVSAEQEYVVHDSHLDLDHGWLNPPTPPFYNSRYEDVRRVAPAGAAGYPVTYRPLPDGWEIEQRAAFDPALKQHGYAYRAGEPTFTDPELGLRWQQARRSALRHLLTVIGGSGAAEHLVLRGSAAMAAWFGAAAREPGDLDFVAIPASMTSDSPAARALLDDIVAAVTARPGAGLRPAETAESAIWTYERADGRRLVIPFGAPGIPDGSVQIDVVFGEDLPIPASPITVFGQRIFAATAELSLAWKLMWLVTDGYPQGKDLYDAVLLAEYTTVDLGLVRELLRPELGGEADAFTAETVLNLPDIDWRNFTDEYPQVEGDGQHWLRRLAIALDR
ncbi:hypothetical protein FB565_004273 [Actinoplanes lutulentus]|uniref:Nucleotidyltransferase AbiEii toxin of type IV toxin-antitoxin system n=1 Tax=Actinoplanes lutulentus TaxID=1287878 RepID=A0A327ZJ36_9ACTN|nr:nucleotidyl transferase AbiEii/AbiGii toxin family protein [Actinoplanes lutulentus]MBB2944544.1 hypothetical protein [Actinoplanes lutulentus]RAK42225.1 nucleotidyltransferase AbiEii toxin of type IV toxin-antitoxin system [Actinoplanes lutulentus]